MELHLQEEVPACLYESCDLVISNPVYGTDTIKDESLAEELPSELRTVRGRYHLELIRGMLALKYDAAGRYFPVQRCPLQCHDIQ